MIMLYTAQTMREADPEMRERYNEIAKACLDEILYGGFLTDKALLEGVSSDGSFCDTPSGRTVNPGHSLEAAWFVISEGLLTGNAASVEAGRKIIDTTLPLGWDAEHGGIIAFTDNRLSILNGI